MVDEGTLLVASVTARAGFFLIFFVYSFRAYASTAYKFWTVSILASALGIWLTYTNGSYPMFDATTGFGIYGIIGLSIVSIWGGALCFFGRRVGVLMFVAAWMLPAVAYWTTSKLGASPSIILTATLFALCFQLSIASCAFLFGSNRRRLPSQLMVGSAIALYATALLLSAVTLMVGLLLDRPDLGPQSGNVFLALFVDQLVSVLIYVGLVAMALEQAQMQMKDIATTDALTGLANRRGLDERTRAVIGVARRRKRPMAVMIADIDHFKAVNDRYGHECGDMILKQFAREIATTVKRQEDVVARWGGEEFVVVLHDAPLDDAVALANAICRKVEATPFDIKTDTIRITVSIGVAALPEDAVDFEKALVAADALLYEAKRSGRNRVCSEALSNAA